MNLKAKLKNGAARVGAVVGGVGLSGVAMAFDETPVTSAITANTATAVLIVGAMILGIWTIRSLGLLKRG